MEARFPGRYRLEVTLPDAIYHKKLYVPPASIQPLVENSLQHGLSTRLAGGWVRVEIELHEEMTVRVRDNGIGFDAEVLTRAGKRLFTRQKGSGIGLYNVNQRLIRLFGPQAELTLLNHPEGGGEVTFTIPITERHDRLSRDNRTIQDILVPQNDRTLQNDDTLQIDHAHRDVHASPKQAF
ncbi:MAG: Autolysin sensor kinase [Candidatus Carbobacillus altaicus]|uniref:Autolysin sensor kinase n=1 Tax=Candidatus Carbonibacillus altaicus TaxID=2163959 RepID=A0A2R6Y1K4_9BACL|nr:MAG: Autolysin sensor kinase [Candidatus Carbobacillus altaicus]